MKIRTILEQDARPLNPDRPVCKYPFPDLWVGDSFFVKTMRGNLLSLPEISHRFRVMARYWRDTRGWHFKVNLRRNDPRGAGVRVRRKA